MKVLLSRGEKGLHNITPCACCEHRTRQERRDGWFAFPYVLLATCLEPRSVVVLRAFLCRWGQKAWVRGEGVCAFCCPGSTSVPIAPTPPPMLATSRGTYINILGRSRTLAPIALTAVPMTATWRPTSGFTQERNPTPVITVLIVPHRRAPCLPIW